MAVSEVCMCRDRTRSFFCSIINIGVGRKSRPHFSKRWLLFRVFRFDIAGTGNIVHRNIIELRKDQQIINGNAGLAAFIVGIGALADMQQVSDPLLRQSVIFPNLAYSLIVSHDLTTLHSKYKEIGKKLDK